jgi:hypothetical protein
MPSLYTSLHDHSFWSILGLLLAMLAMHALADFPLQGPYIASVKNHNTPDPHAPWWYMMSVHAMIHAGMVLAATGSVIISLVEFGIHWLTDHQKCSGEITYLEDQVTHILLKVLYVAIILVFPQIP